MSPVIYHGISKNGRVLINAVVDKVQTIPAQTRWKICTIPQEFRPQNEYFAPIMAHQKESIGTCQTIYMHVSTDGGLYVISPVQLNTAWYIDISLTWDISQITSSDL